MQIYQSYQLIPLIAFNNQNNCKKILITSHLIYPLLLVAYCTHWGGRGGGGFSLQFITESCLLSQVFAYPVFYLCSYSRRRRAVRLTMTPVWPRLSWATPSPTLKLQTLSGSVSSPAGRLSTAYSLPDALFYCWSSVMRRWRFISPSCTREAPWKSYSFFITKAR